MYSIIFIMVEMELYLIQKWLLFHLKGGEIYKVVMCCKEGVRPARPYLPKNGIISVRRFTQWILMKF